MNLLQIAKKYVKYIYERALYIKTTYNIFNL
jgi:hypothetical protein